MLKQQALNSFKLCLSVGKPRQGVLFDSIRRDKAVYKLAKKNKEKSRANEFSNSLDDVLSSKDMNRFWKS